MSLLPSTLYDIADHAMREIWNRTPNDFQREAIPRLLMMRCTPNIPQALLLVQGTGGGKSAVAQTVGVVDCGVTLVIEELLAVATDQKSKVLSASNAYGPILAYQLDSMKDPSLVNKLQTKLLALKKTSNCTIFLYSSPECLMRQPWRTLMIRLINNGVLKLVCVDEIHLYVMFGLTFRKEFIMLKDSFFKHLIDAKMQSRNRTNTDLCCYLKVPLLLMTATFNPRLVSLMESMIGVKILRENYLWSSRDKMARRNIKMSVLFTTQTKRYIKTVLTNSLCDNIEKKCIIYTNTASCLDQLRVDLEQWMNSSDIIKGDVLIIHGDMKKEVKFVSAERFTTTVTNPQELIDSNQYYPRILLATAGSIGAGLDSSDVFSVTRIGFPTSVIDMAQEMGRCGRGINKGPGEFHLLLSLNDFVYLNQRLYLPRDPLSVAIKPLLTTEDEINMQRDNLLDLLKLIVLKGACWHVQLENCLGNPCEPPATSILNCEHSCPVCNSDIDSYIMPINRRGMCAFLADVFINNASTPVTPENLEDKLKKYNSVGTVIYCRPRSPKPPPAKYVTVTVLQLIASRIIKLSFDKTTMECTCRLVVVDAQPAYLTDLVWSNLYTIDS